MWDSVAHYKEIPSGASEPIAWDRCNYSDNIREPALPAVLSPRLEKWGLGWGMQLPCPALHFLHLSFCLLSFSPRSFFIYFLTSVSPYMNSFIFFPPLLREHMFIYSPLFSVVCKAEFVPVGWKSNEGNHAVTVQLLIVPPHPSLFADCEPQTRQMLSLYASSVSYIHLPSRNSWLLQYLFDSRERVPPVCSMQRPWSQPIHPNVSIRNTLSLPYYLWSWKIST